MSQGRIAKLTDPAIQVISASLGASLAGPLGGALGGWLGAALGSSIAPVVSKYLTKFGEKAGEALLETAGKSLRSKLSHPPELESILREALRLSLRDLRLLPDVTDAESWFENWDICLASSNPPTLPFVRFDHLHPQELDTLLTSTMEQLDAQGSALNNQSLSLMSVVRPLPTAVSTLLRTRLPERLHEHFRVLILREENAAAAKQLQLLIEDLQSEALKRIEVAVGLVPGVAAEVTEIHRLLTDELFRGISRDTLVREEMRVALGRAEAINSELRDLRKSRVESDTDSRFLGEIEAAQASMSQLGLALMDKADRSTASPVRPRLWNIPGRNDYFSGRVDYLAELRRELTESGAAALTQRSTRAIRGLGGIGKTQTAVEYAYRYESEYSAGFFVVADSPANIDEGFADIARLLGADSQLEVSQLARRSQDLLQQPRNAGWLLIIDNLEDVSHVMHRLPNRGGHILLTTRLNSVGRIGRGIDLAPMSTAEGTSFLLHRVGLEMHVASSEADQRQIDAAHTLTELMGGLPLALDQAAAYIIEVSSSVEEYLRYYKDESRELLNRAGADADHDTVRATFNLAFERLSLPAQDVLRLCSMLTPDGIPEDVIFKGQPDRITREAIGEAARYSLLTLNTEGPASTTRKVTVHRLVQDVIRDMLSVSERRIWIDRALHAVNRLVLGSETLRDRRGLAQHLLGEQFEPYRTAFGNGASSSFRVEFDPIPYVILAEEWLVLEKGIKQRALLLDALLTDVYGPQQARTIMPDILLEANPHYLAACKNLPIAEGRHLTFYSAELVRDKEGNWRVIKDYTDAISGLSNIFENRSVLSKVTPHAFEQFEIRPLDAFFEEYIAAIRQLAVKNQDNTHVVLLTPGVYNSAYYEHAYLANRCGFSLVEGRDLFAEDGQIYEYTVRGPRAVDVILRRIDSDYSDPLIFRPESILGIPGLVEAVKSKTVVIVNSLGSGFASTPGLRPFLAGLCKLLLKQELLLTSSPTWWLGDANALEEVKERLNDFVIEGIFDRHPSSSRVAKDLTRQEQEAVFSEIDRTPERFLLTKPFALSDLPISAGHNDEMPHTTVLQIFAVATKDGYSVIPGALAKLLNSSGGIFATKDTWVLGHRESFPIASSRGPQVTEGSTPLRLVRSLFVLATNIERLWEKVRELRTLIGSARTEDEDHSSSGGLITQAVPVSDALRLTAPDRLNLESKIIALVSGEGGKEGERSVGWLVDAIASNLHSIQLQLPQKSREALLLLRPIYLRDVRSLNPATHEGVQLLCARLDDVLTEFMREVVSSAWRGIGWHALSLGSHSQLARNMCEVALQAGHTTLQHVQPELTSELRQTLWHLEFFADMVLPNASLREVLADFGRSLETDALVTVFFTLDRVINTILEAHTVDVGPEL